MTLEREIIGLGLAARYSLVIIYRYDRTRVAGNCDWPDPLRFCGFAIQRHKHPLADQVKSGDTLRKMLNRAHEYKKETEQ